MEIIGGGHHHNSQPAKLYQNRFITFYCYDESLWLSLETHNEKFYCYGLAVV